MTNVEVRPRNWLIATALVMLREESSYGYKLMERLEKLGFGEINPGTLYRKLRQMEREGLCKSEWKTSDSGPARRVYSLTDVAYWVRDVPTPQQAAQMLQENGKPPEE
jgi:PadR family transcriptional regulator